MSSISTENEGSVAALAAVTDNLRHRRTVALFEDRPVVRQHVEDAIELARWAPNHHLTEPWHFYLLGDKARLSTLELVEDIVGKRANPDVGARKRAKWEKVPGWVVVTCKRNEDKLIEREDYAACCCAIHNFSLYLWQLGIGMKWSSGSIIRDERYYDALGFNADQEFIVGLISYGYPKLIPTQKRKSASEIMTSLA
ncbi:MAG: nitroreductase [Gammaproteobacteria bacterium]